MTLASASPRRQALLRALWIEFRIVPSLADEAGSLPDDGCRRAEALALRKAAEVATRVGEGLVLGADTIVECDGRLLGKPRDRDEARRFLRLLSGRSHLVVTALALVEAGGGRTVTGREVTEVCVRPLMAEEIDAYVGTDEPLDKAGGYAIQGAGGAFVEGIKGSFTNVVGLPLGRLRALLLRFGIDPLSRELGTVSDQR
jgi:septum formation protein